MLKLLRGLVVLAGLLGALLPATAPAQPARNAPVAMVTDLEGPASLIGEKRSLAILEDLSLDQRIELGKGARMVLVFLKSGDEYAFKGPALVLVRQAQADAVSGAKPEKRSTLFGGSGREIRISPIGVNQGAVLMRSMPGEPRLSLLSLSETITLDSWPEFRWRGIQAGTLGRLQLFDDKGRQILEREVSGDAMTLPGDVRLKSGIRYRWIVAGKGPGGQAVSGAAHFSFASLELRSEAERLRPGTGATLSEQVIYAAWLEQKELHDEARKYWRMAASERPNDSRLRELAGPF